MVSVSTESMSHYSNRLQCHSNGQMSKHGISECSGTDFWLPKHMVIRASPCFSNICRSLISSMYYHSFWSLPYFTDPARSCYQLLVACLGEWTLVWVNGSSRSTSLILNISWWQLQSLPIIWLTNEQLEIINTNNQKQGELNSVRAIALPSNNN